MSPLPILLVLCDSLSIPILILVSHYHHHRLDSSASFYDYELHPFSMHHSLFDMLIISLVRATVMCMIIPSLSKSLPELKQSPSIQISLLVIFISVIYTIVKASLWHFKWHSSHSHSYALRSATVVLECIIATLYLIATTETMKSAAKRTTLSVVVSSKNGMGQPLLDAHPHAENSLASDAAKAEKKKLRISSLKRVATLASPERALLLSGLGGLVVASASQMFVPFILGKLITVVGKDDSTSADLNRVIILMLVTCIVSALATCWRGIAFTVAGERLAARLRKELFCTVTSQEIGFFDGLKSGELVNRLAADTTVIQDIATVNISMGLRWLAQAVIGIGVLFVISWHLSLVMMAAVPAVASIAVVYGRYTRQISKNYQKSLADAGEVASEVLSNMKTVRSLFRGEVREHARYCNAVSESYHFGKLRAYAYGGWSGIVMMFAYFSVVLCLWYGGHEVLRGHMQAGFLTSFLLYTIYITVALGGLADLFTKLMTAVGASERMFELLDRKPKIPVSGGLIPANPAGHVILKDVDFAYPQRPDVPVLKQVCLECRPSEVVALVGRSGAGKSTIVALIERFYDVDGGALLIDGVDIKSIDPEWLHKYVALVGQEPVLFASSIGENIANGTDKCTQQQIEDAARLANAHDFISAFPEGYNTLVGERGVQLSGGQKQRIAIARAIIANPRILLLDEATSALDAESEHLVQAAIDTLMLNRTVIIVAHRLSTVKNAAKVVVLDGSGTIAQTGTHAQLVEDQQGLYYNLVHRQLQM